LTILARILGLFSSMEQHLVRFSSLAEVFRVGWCVVENNIKKWLVSKKEKKISQLPAPVLLVLGRWQ
jgi:hypothetical protein